ncbi:30S ribosomal protein S9 [Nitzschia inconspicua]|uniref:30S ribosomal protein S9 n=1 Tax=Nitzschia inconspicua TaxID=303405 RepID=A0A9K3Q3K0_9STRA|nr:30S ribosomal protein S9 [Nitzschia inconspicua]
MIKHLVSRLGTLTVRNNATIAHLVGVGNQRIVAATATTTSVPTITQQQQQQQVYFSSQPSFSLPRPTGHPESPNALRKWRSHAVSLELGDYGDDDDDDDDDSLALSKTTNQTESWQEEEWELAQQVQEIQRQEDLKKQRWLENAKPPVRHSIIDERGRSYGRGGRKTAAARVWIQPGFGNVVVNQKDFVDYFDRMTDREHILAPLAATESLGKFDVMAIVHGGGLTGQAGAIRHGLSRALNHYNPDKYRPPLKRLGYLTRDPRKVERKKVGHLKARKKPQWVKR